MSSGLLDFFTLEASEYVEQLDGLVSRTRDGLPEPDSFVRVTRALRGSATMAKVGGVADVAGGLERVARALKEGRLAWGDGLRSTCIAAIDDLKILIRGARTWGEPEALRASNRSRELAALVPAASGVESSVPFAPAFLATEAAELAEQFSRFAENPVGPAAFAGTLQRVRALRGVALLKDLPPLPEVVDALDHAAKLFELGGAVTPTLRTLFSTAAALLAEGGLALSRGERPSTASAALNAFVEAAAAFGGGSSADDIVPISALFPDDGAPGIISASVSPPTTAALRFRLEVVSHAEHLRRLVADAAHAVDDATRNRLARELGDAARSLGRMAASFSEPRLAEFFDAQRSRAALLEHAALRALDQACQLLSAPLGKATADIVNTLGAPEAAPVPGPVPVPSTVPVPVPSTVPVPVPSTVPVPVPSAVPVPVPPTVPVPVSDTVPVPVPLGASEPIPIQALAPDEEPSLVSLAPVAPAVHAAAGASGDALSTLLQQGIRELEALDEGPLAEPSQVADEVIVPIEDLLYRGRDALDRAIEVRDMIRRSPGAPDPEMLAELFDLLELAATPE